eukprot:2104963-Prymnesium_polylepis.1
MRLIANGRAMLCANCPRAKGGESRSTVAAVPRSSSQSSDGEERGTPFVVAFFNGAHAEGFARQQWTVVRKSGGQERSKHLATRAGSGGRMHVLDNIVCTTGQLKL